MTQTFLGLALADPTSIARRRTRATTYAWNGHADETARPDGRIVVMSRVVPDAGGRDNLAGVVEAHMLRHGTAKPFVERCPQKLGTLAAGQAVRTVAAKAAAGAVSVTASGDVSGVKPGRIVTVGASARLRVVTAVAGRTIGFDMPLPEALARGAALDWSPNGSWLWPPDALDNPPAFANGVAGAGWILHVVEAV